LVGEWHFNETDGNIAYDFSGNGNDGTINGASWVGGVSGSALSFDGNDYVNTNLHLPQGSKTVEAWIKGFGTTYSTECPIAGERWYSAAGGGEQLNLGVKTDESAMLYVYSEDKGSGVNAVSDSNILDQTKWHHIVGTYEVGDTDAVLKIYIDGTLHDTVHGPIDIDNHISTYLIGVWRRGTGAVGVRYFKGVIDEVRIYNNILSPEKIQAHYNAYA